MKVIAPAAVVWLAAKVMELIAELRATVRRRG